MKNHPGEVSIYEKQLNESYELSSDYNKFKNICETVGFPKKSVDNFTMFFNNEMNNILLQILKWVYQLHTLYINFMNTQDTLGTSVQTVHMKLDVLYAGKEKAGVGKEGYTIYRTKR